MRSRGTGKDGKTGTKCNWGILLRRAQMKLLNPFLWVFFLLLCVILIYLFIYFTKVQIIGCIIATLSVTSSHDWFASSQFRPWASIKDTLQWRWRLLRLLTPIVGTERKSYQRIHSNNVTCHTEKTPLTSGWTSLSLTGADEMLFKFEGKTDLKQLLLFFFLLTVTNNPQHQIHTRDCTTR